MHIGILGGTFDPVHFGHLHLAISCLEARDLSEVWWVPTQQNPLKGDFHASALDRLAMVKLAIQDIPEFQVLDIEALKQGPCYTIDTIRTLKAMRPQAEFHLILGDDALSRFHEWKDPLEVIDLAPPIIGARISKTFPEGLPFSKEIIKVLKHGWTPIPLIEISATEIRKRLKEKLFCGHLIPAKVLDYIEQNGLYFFA